VVPLFKAFVLMSENRGKDRKNRKKIERNKVF
jgi:hypothetical protein